MSEITVESVGETVVDPTAPDPDPVGDVRIDRSPGSGSLTREEAWASERAHGSTRSFENDGRSKTRTTFYYDSSTTESSWMRDRDRHQLDRDPSDRRGWETLAGWNDGVGDSDRKQENNDSDVRRWVQTFCNQLDCTGFQTDRVQYIVSDMDLTDIKVRRLSTEKVILATISLVVDADASVGDVEEWSIDEWVVYRDDFEGLMDSVGMSRGELWQLREYVHSNCEQFGEAV